jgi:hypothetical protein
LLPELKAKLCTSYNLSAAYLQSPAHPSSRQSNALHLLSQLPGEVSMTGAGVENRQGAQSNFLITQNGKAANLAPMETYSKCNASTYFTSLLSRSPDHAHSVVGMLLHLLQLRLPCARAQGRLYSSAQTRSSAFKFGLKVKVAAVLPAPTLTQTWMHETSNSRRSP